VVVVLERPFSFFLLVLFFAFVIFPHLDCLGLLWCSTQLFCLWRSAKPLAKCWFVVLRLVFLLQWGLVWCGVVGKQVGQVEGPERREKTRKQEQDCGLLAKYLKMVSEKKSR